MKAFDIAVMPGATWIDVSRFDVVIFQPLLDFGGDTFGAIITADVAGNAILDNRLFQDLLYFRSYTPTLGSITGPYYFNA